ncbi:hypothetical protein GQ473_05505 [archaeon]|nr:hypothetical protein [archaeon]
MMVQFTKYDLFESFGVPNGVNITLGLLGYGVNNVSFYSDNGGDGIPSQIDVQLKPNALGTILGFDEIYTYIITKDTIPENFSTEMIINLISNSKGEVRVDGFLSDEDDISSHLVNVPKYVVLKESDMNTDETKNTGGTPTYFVDGGCLMYFRYFSKKVYEHIAQNN